MKSQMVCLLTIGAKFSFYLFRFLHQKAGKTEIKGPKVPKT